MKNVRDCSRTFFSLLFRDFNQLREAFGVVDSQIGQHLAVDFDVLLLQAGDEPGIADPVQPCSSVDTGDPQAAEFALAELSSDESIAQAAGNLFFRGAVLLGFRSEVALRQLHNLAAAFMGVHSPLDTCHDCFPPCRLMGSFVRQQLMNRTGFGGIVDNTGVPQVTGALGGLQMHLMVGVHLLMLYNTGFGKGKALGSSAVGFLFRHSVWSSFQCGYSCVSFEAEFSLFAFFSAKEALMALGARIMIMLRPSSSGRRSTMLTSLHRTPILRWYETESNDCYGT